VAVFKYESSLSILIKLALFKI